MVAAQYKGTLKIHTPTAGRKWITALIYFTRFRSGRELNKINEKMPVLPVQRADTVIQTTALLYYLLKSNTL